MITNRLRLHSVQLPLGIVENMEKELTSVKEARSHFSRSHPFVFESPIILAVVHARKTLKKKNNIHSGTPPYYHIVISAAFFGPAKLPYIFW